MSLEAMKLVRTMLQVGMPEYDINDALQVLDEAIEQAEKQEPVAWIYTGIKQDGSTHGPHLVWKLEYMDAMSADKGAKANAIPLYTTPPAAPYRAVKTVHEGKPIYVSEPAAQRQWVGLTPQNKHDLLPTVQLKDEDPKTQVWLTRKDAFAYADAIEAKLREKNGGQA